ncbi:thioredoxin family protein [Tenacibaculum sp. MEBiC06402]|uniref:thioredoxin family protein n=1 Tax=unclassified Tenacibaculum TaxID=2635139 RepID=UPI003B9C32C7
MRKLVLLAVVVLSTISVQAQEVNWLSFEEALELNKKNPKPIMIDLYTDWCGWCKRMDATTYKNEVIIKYINDNYYAVKMDGEGKEDITFKGRTFKFVQKGRSKYHELAAAILNGKLSYPSTAFFDSKEQLIQAVPGYLVKERFEKILAYFSGDAYKNTPWKDFEKNFKSSL